jgi:hypothetical protein
VNFDDIDQKEVNDLLAAFLTHKYPKKYQGKIIDFLSLSVDKIADFLMGKQKNGKDKEKIYDEFHNHLMETLSEHFSNDIDDDIDDSYNEFYSKENYKANEINNKIKRIKEQEDDGCFIKNIFDLAAKCNKKSRKNVFEEAYHRYNKARLQYFQTINYFKELDQQLNKNKLCQKT